MYTYRNRGVVILYIYSLTDNFMFTHMAVSIGSINVTRMPCVEFVWIINIISLRRGLKRAVGGEYAPNEMTGKQKEVPLGSRLSRHALMPSLL